MEKKRKAEDKRKRRKERKAAESALPQHPSDGETKEVAQATSDDLPADDD